MDRLGALTSPLDTVLSVVDVVHENEAEPVRKNGRFAAPIRPRKQWPPSQVAKAATLVTGKPGAIDRPHAIPFSYITWAAYSEFPDCGETAIRNLLNQMLYNPETSKFDHELLTELRDKYYPRLSTNLINFYRSHPRPQDVTDQHIALEWIDVVSQLNRARNDTSREAPAVRYRRDKEEQNIASPLSNLLRACNALFGIEPLDDMDRIKEVVFRINDLRSNYNLSLDTSGIKHDGFGSLSIAAGEVRYELQSYKPVHFGFIQIKTSQTAATGRYEFGAFRKLMNYTASSHPRGSPDEWSYLEQLAVGSLFIPYQLQRNDLGRFFRSVPVHYPLLFADLEGASSKESALQWARTHEGESNELSTLVERIHNYVEPSFGPQKGEDLDP
jgi:hypothetical protein